MAGRWPRLERDVANELVQEHAMQTSSGRACTKCCSQQCKDVSCSTDVWAFSNGFLPGLILFMVVLLILFAVLIVAPHAQAASYKKTTCRVSSIEDQEEVQCPCPTEYPCSPSNTICVKINVKYERDDGKTVGGLLHNTEEDLDAKCTSAPCSHDNLVDNKHDVESRILSDYRSMLGGFKDLDCLYDPTEGSTKVIMRQAYTEDGTLINMMLWPSLVMLLGIGCFVFLIYTYGTRYACIGKVPPKHVSLIAAQLRAHGIFKLHTLPVEERRRLLRECAPEPTEVPALYIQRS